MYYDTELRREGCHARIRDWLRLAYDHQELNQSEDRHAILSFPHTAIGYSGPLQARVIARLIRQGFRRVIALGVVHGSLVPDYRLASDDDTPLGERLAAIERVSGAYSLAVESVDTPFGALAVTPPSAEIPMSLRLESADLLRREFSLDTFHAMLRVATDVFGASPIRVLPIYVGMTRHPVTGSFEIASCLADWLRDEWDDQTAIVTTGDVIHYGAFYGSQDDGSETEVLESLFRSRLDTLFHSAFVDRDLESAYQMSLRELKSDQREILPLLVQLLGSGACASVEALELSDYSEILDSSPPCLVASALIAYKNRDATR